MRTNEDVAHAAQMRSLTSAGRLSSLELLSINRDAYDRI